MAAAAAVGAVFALLVMPRFSRPSSPASRWDSWTPNITRADLHDFADNISRSVSRAAHSGTASITPAFERLVDALSRVDTGSSMSLPSTRRAAGSRRRRTRPRKSWADARRHRLQFHPRPGVIAGALLFAVLLRSTNVIPGLVPGSIFQFALYPVVRCIPATSAGMTKWATQCFFGPVAGKRDELFAVAGDVAEAPGPSSRPWRRRYGPSRTRRNSTRCAAAHPSVRRRAG